MYKYPGMKKKMGEFELAIVAGEFTDSEIMVMLGENGKFPLFCGIWKSVLFIQLLGFNYCKKLSLGAGLNSYIFGVGHMLGQYVI